MKGITQKELHTAYLNSLALAQANTLNEQCDNSHRAVAALKITAALAGLLAKITHKGEPEISQGKTARAVAKHIHTADEADLFDEIFAHLENPPRLADHTA